MNKYTTKSEVKSSFELEVNDRTRGTGQVGYKVTELELPDLGCCCSWHARHCQPMDARIWNGCQAICKYVVACDGLFQPHSVLVSRIKDVVDICISTQCGWKELQLQGADQVSFTCSPKSHLAKKTRDQVPKPSNLPQPVWSRYRPQRCWTANTRKYGIIPPSDALLELIY